MTTEVPQHPVYPTAPPWAPPPPARAYGPAGAPPPPHGSLLVPYPEEMQNAARPKPPAVWPIAPLTFFLTIPGLVSTVRRARQARRGRNSVAPYWIVFALSVMASGLAALMVVGLGVPLYLAYREDSATRAVESNLIHDGSLARSSGVTVQGATCEPVGPRAADQTRAYTCLLKLGDGRAGTLTVRAHLNGTWTAVRRTR